MPSAPSGPSWSMRSGSLLPARMVATWPAARRCFTRFCRISIEVPFWRFGLGRPGVAEPARREAHDVGGLVVEPMASAQTLDHAEGVRCPLQELREHQIVETETCSPRRLHAEIASGAVGGLRAAGENG